MKAKVIETGEIVEVNLYGDPYYKEKGQGYDRRGWYADELEFPPGPKMVSLDKVCEWVKEHYLEYPNEDLSDTKKFISDLRKEFE